MKTIINNQNNAIQAIQFTYDNLNIGMLNELIEYLKNIFLDEEKVLTSYGFPDINSSHKELHRDMLKFLCDMKYSKIDLKVFKCMFNDHLQIDNEYMPYLRINAYCIENGF
jgi:hemerythrin